MLVVVPGCGNDVRVLVFVCCDSTFSFANLRKYRSVDWAIARVICHDLCTPSCCNHKYREGFLISSMNEI